MKRKALEMAPAAGEGGGTAALFAAAAARGPEKRAATTAVPPAAPQGAQGPTGRGFLCRANDAIHLKLVRSAADVDDDAAVFHPQFTHQHYKDELIFGYRGLRVDWYYIGSTLECLVRETHDEVVTRRDAGFGFGMGSTEQRPPDDVLGPINKHVPHAIDNAAVFKGLAGGAFDPAALGLVRVSTAPAAEGAAFEVWSGDFASAALREYHRRLRVLLLLFVDAASFIDDTDQRWRVYIVFERRPRRAAGAGDGGALAAEYCVAGYATVYRYYAYPDRERHRLSQMLVLPPFQRRGLGERLYAAVYADAAAARATEVTVEDPSPAMARLRLLVDARLCLARGLVRSGEWALDGAAQRRAHEEERLNKRQVKKLAEVFAMMTVDFADEEHSYKPFRLMVKRRLWHEEQEELGVIEDARTRKQRLHEMFMEAEAEYRPVVAALQRQSPHQPGEAN